MAIDGMVRNLKFKNQRGKKDTSQHQVYILETLEDIDIEDLLIVIDLPIIGGK